MTDLYRRGLTEIQMEIIAVDGGKGALAALRTVYPGVPEVVNVNETVGFIN
jgi:transposase-like protein